MEMKKLEKVSNRSKAINEKLDRKNNEFKERINKEKEEEQKILEKIKYKLENPLIYRMCVKNSLEIQNIIEDFKNIKTVGSSKNKLKKIEKELDKKIEEAKLELEEFVENFKVECLKSELLNQDIEILIPKVVKLFMNGKI